MDDLLKQLGGAGKQDGGGDLLGGIGDMLGSGGLASILGGAVGGGLGGSLGGGMGGLLGGGLGAILPALLPSIMAMLGGKAGEGTSGIGQLVDGMRARGLGDKADSWVGTGTNEPVSAAEVEQALGPDKLRELSAESGLPTEQVAEGLAAILPGLVDHLTPGGEVPDAETAQARLRDLMRPTAPG